MKADHMGTDPVHPSPRELPLSNQTRFSLTRGRIFGRINPLRFGSPGSGRMCGPLLRRVVSCLVSRTPRKSACAFRAGLGAKSIHARIRKGQQLRLELARWGINGLLTNARPVWGGER